MSESDTERRALVAAVNAARERLEAADSEYFAALRALDEYNARGQLSALGPIEQTLV